MTDEDWVSEAQLESIRYAAKHGKYSTYNNHGCRCGKCRAAKSEHDLKLKDFGVPSKIKHGTHSAYQKYGCRCEVCRSFHSEYMKRYQKGNGYSSPHRPLQGGKVGRTPVPIVEKNCEWCGGSFQYRVKDHRRFCSTECGLEFLASQAKRKKEAQAIICNDCGKTFYSKSRKRREFCIPCVSKRKTEAIKTKKRSKYGSGLIDKAGYVSVKVPEGTPGRRRSGYIRRARLVMQQMLGRPLLLSESIHHINGVKDDDRPENLQLRQGSHGAGQVIRCQDCGSFDIKDISLSGRIVKICKTCNSQFVDFAELDN